MHDPGIRPNSQFWHTSVDGSWKFITNALGFRNTTEVDFVKPPKLVRILSLGDSHTNGYEVRQEATFSAVLERHLRHNGVNAEVINAGARALAPRRPSSCLRRYHCLVADAFVDGQSVEAILRVEGFAKPTPNRRKNDKTTSQLSCVGPA